MQLNVRHSCTSFLVIHDNIHTHWKILKYYTFEGFFLYVDFVVSKSRSTLWLIVVDSYFFQKKAWFKPGEGLCCWLWERLQFLLVPEEGDSSFQTVI